MTSVQEICSLENACEQLIKTDKVRHVAVINHLGRMIAGRFRPGITRFLDDDKIQMVYMHRDKYRNQ